tara:strand:+ start:247 stop:498 length:252 start_codon:yes stop_codon:yes gene_type:complete
MKIKNNDQIGDKSGQRVFNFAPGSGEINVYRLLPTGEFSTVPFLTINNTTPEKQRMAILPVGVGLRWKFELSVDATATYSELN